MISNSSVNRVLFEWNSSLPINRSKQSDMQLWHKKGKNDRVWVNVERESQSNQVILIGIRTEVSRHFELIIVLGFGTCWLVWISQMLGDQKGMIGNLQHCLGLNAMKPAYLMVYQEYIKVQMDKCLLVISALSTRDMQSQILYRIEIHAKAQENRLTMLK
jgi:hypothetical protein